MNDLVSVVIPMYNVERYIESCIQSVLNQTYENIEIICVDDCSTDDTFNIVTNMKKKFQQIIVFPLTENKGAANARNIAIQNSNGRYIAFLDADDLWYSDKIESQLNYMNNNNYSFSCTDCKNANERGTVNNQIIKVLPEFTLKDYLTHNLIQTPSVMVDLKRIDRQILYAPETLRMRNDIYVWINVLKKGYICGGFNKPLTVIRRHKGSLSNNKVQAIKGMWNIYFKHAEVSSVFASYCFVRYAFLAVWKRISLKKEMI